MDKVRELWQENKEISAKTKQRFMILLKRDLTDQEQLLRTFGDGKESDKAKSKQTETETESTEKKEEVIDLQLKKNFYYVIAPGGEVVDCAKIYSFLHEDNIFKRVTARVSKHVDSKISMG